MNVADAQDTGMHQLSIRRWTTTNISNNHAYCEEHADTENWGEYMYIGFHKADWRWLKKKGIEKSLITHNERIDLPSWLASHVKEDGVRWGLGLYGGYHGFDGCKCLEDVVKATEQYNDVIIEERKV